MEGRGTEEVKGRKEEGEIDRMRRKEAETKKER